MTLLDKFRKRAVQPFDVYDPVWGGWNYPTALYPLGEQLAPDQDGYLKHLIYMAEHGWYYCQKAIIEMHLIYPLTDYHPPIDPEFRDTFTARFKDDPLPLLIYERDGKFIMANDYQAYWLYREQQVPIATCILIGQFIEEPGVAVLERPFQIKRDETLAKYLRHPLV